MFQNKDGKEDENFIEGAAENLSSAFENFEGALSSLFGFGEAAPAEPLMPAKKIDLELPLKKIP